MMPKLKKEYADSRKKEIIWTAWQSFMEIGYEKTTMREIAKRMDATTGVLYTYFKTKGDILKELQNAILENNARCYAEMNKKDSVSEAYRELFSYEFKAPSSKKAREKAKLFVSLLAEAPNSEGISELVNASYRATEKRGSNTIAKGIKSGEIHTNIDPKALSAMFQALWYGLWMQIAVLDGLNVKSHVNGILNILLGNTWRKPEVMGK
jgi:AcrR family transcriptional regulator